MEVELGLWKEKGFQYMLVIESTAFHFVKGREKKIIQECQIKGRILMQSPSGVVNQKTYHLFILEEWYQVEKNCVHFCLFLTSVFGMPLSMNYTDPQKSAVTFQQEESSFPQSPCERCGAVLFIYFPLKTNMISSKGAFISN